MARATILILLLVGRMERLPAQITTAFAEKSTAAEATDPDFYADYSRGFAIRPSDFDKHPFELQVNAWIQFRNHVFIREASNWTDNAGITRPIRNREVFDIERARLVFSGRALDERLSYFLQMDGDTDGAETVDFFDYWWAWQFTEDFRVQLGKRKVPASTQWQLSARSTRFVDRPMANDFFRPDRTTGLFGTGKIGESVLYELMVANGYRTANLPAEASDEQLTFAAMSTWDAVGSFGKDIVDFDHSADPRIRLGHSMVYSPQSSLQQGIPLGEADFIRLTDGTKLTEPGALAPDVTVSDFDVFLYAVEVGAKYDGWSMNAELYLRWLEGIRGNGPLPLADLFQRGFYVEGGRFLIDKSLDANLRYSQVAGAFGNRAEYSAGTNWYPLKKQQMKISFDVTYLDGSPLQNTSSDILAGDEGFLLRTQFQAEF